MEIYGPYIAMSGMTSFVGSFAYYYFNMGTDITDNIVNESDNSESSIDTINYSLIHSNLTIRDVNSSKDRHRLGVTTKDKMGKLRTILSNECGRHLPINNTKKVRTKWMRLISEYENMGHDEFVYIHSKHKRD
jgi:pullulanase/glycogen debranching enzyme